MVLLHHKPPQSRAWHWGKGQSWWREDVQAQGTDKGPHADKGKGNCWGVPHGSGTSCKGCVKGHQGKQADKGKPVEGKGWDVLPGHADKGKPVEGKGWGVHHAHWPSDTGLQGKRADKGKLVEGVRARAARPNTSPKSRGVHNGSQNQAKLSKPQRGKRQAHQRSIARTWRRRRRSLPA